MRRLLCLFGLHEWRSTFLYNIPGRAGHGWIMHPRNIFENRCERCGRESGPTYRYEKEESAE